MEVRLNKDSGDDVRTSGRKVELRCPTSWSTTEHSVRRSILEAGQSGHWHRRNGLVLHPPHLSKLARVREVVDRHLHVLHRFRQDV